MTSTTSMLDRPERHAAVATTFVSMITALAFAEMVPSVKVSFANDGVTLVTSVLGFVFFITTLRMWIGNELHLRSPNVTSGPGHIWFCDFMVIVIEATLFIFWVRPARRNRLPSASSESC